MSGPVQRVVTWIVALFVVGGCEFPADRDIADQFHARLVRGAKTFGPRSCEGRGPKLERMRKVVPLVTGLSARVRRYETTMPPVLHGEVMAADLLGAAEQYRCLVKDFRRVDLETEPNFHGGMPHFANLLLLKAKVLLEVGEADAGWAHIVEAIELFRDPIGFTFGKQLDLAPALATARALMERYPPPLEVVERLADAVDATYVSPAVACTGVRHDIVQHMVFGFHEHFGEREKRAAIERFGRDYAKVMWYSAFPGKQDRAVWNLLREGYDIVVKGCAKRPLTKTVLLGLGVIPRLREAQPMQAAAFATVLEELKQLRGLSDAQLALSAALRAMAFQRRHGRYPTPAEHIQSITFPMKSPWDLTRPAFQIEGRTLTVRRGYSTIAFVLPEEGKRRPIVLEDLQR